MREDHPVKAGSEYLASFQARGRGELNLYLKVPCHLKEPKADAREMQRCGEQRRRAAGSSELVAAWGWGRSFQYPPDLSALEKIMVGARCP